MGTVQTQLNEGLQEVEFQADATAVILLGLYIAIYLYIYIYIKKMLCLSFPKETAVVFALNSTA